MKKIKKITLELDGNKVNTLEELQENFSIEIMDYLNNGALLRWLSQRQLNDKCAAIEALANIPPEQLYLELAKIFGVNIHEKKIILDELKIGQKVIDKSWKWEYKNEDNYTGAGGFKPVTWIVAGKDHYHGVVRHVTLLSEDLIGRYSFDEDSISNCWEKSPLRSFLNKAFYQQISKNFAQKIIRTKLPNATDQGEQYTTDDYIFILSRTELGGGDEDTYHIGEALHYFSVQNEEELKKRRTAGIPIEGNDWYWTRSPDSNDPYCVCVVNSGGGFYSLDADYSDRAIRPVLNLSSETPIYVIKKDDDIYEIVW